MNADCQDTANLSLKQKKAFEVEKFACKIDEQALTQIDTIDSELVQQWEEKLRSLLEVDEVAIVIQEEVKNLQSLHLSDLLADWKADKTSNINQSSAIPLKTTTLEPNSETKQLAVSHGDQLQLPKDAPATLSQALQKAALQSKEKNIVYVDSDGKEAVQSYSDLLQEAERILNGLNFLNLKPQDKIIFQFDRNQDFVAAFWACILGGFVPVPIAAASSYREVNSTVNKLHHAWQMLDKPIILTSQKLASNIRSLSDFLILEDFNVETIEELRSHESAPNWHTPDPDDLALIMLTSGSTGMPKGVMLSHRNLLSRSASTAQMNNFSSEEVSLNWFPLDHVGGLVMFHIRDVYLHCQQIQIAKEAILQNPLKWLDWIEHYRASIAWSPNFAFGLINDRAEEIRQRQWDLSSMRFILNGGEAIVAKTARRFLELLHSQGLPCTAIHPAWGMSETSSGITFSDSFCLDVTTDSDPFVEVGSPIPGISLRIVDSNNQIVEENTIGRLQVKGLSVTSGYYRQPEINKEVFTEDGWFNTGDLGFLNQGRLTITGRAKDVIIINGLNYYSHEIEAVVEEVEGVKVSYTAACAVRTSSSDSDSLAIFFHTYIDDSIGLASLLKDIRSSVVRQIGVNPNYLIPVPKETIPKTEIGKIQRAQLSQRFLAGEFDSILKQIDIATENTNTLPDWFYRPIWRPKVATPRANLPKTGYYLLFIDRLGLGTILKEELCQLNCLCISVDIGDEFKKLASDLYQVNPSNAEHYKLLLASLAEDGISIEGIFHLWTYNNYQGEFFRSETLEESLQIGIYSLLFLVQALSQVKIADHSIQLQIISSYSQPTSPADKIAYEKAPLLGLLKTVSQEIPNLNCRHIDLAVDLNTTNVAYILQEIQSGDNERQIAYRDSKRLIPRLEKVDWQQEKKQPLPLKCGGMYLLTGGLGGISVEIAKYLLASYQAKLLLVGRTQLPPRNTWSSRIKQGDAVSDRIKTFLSLEQLGGEIRYEAVDICDEAELQQAVEGASLCWQSELDGIIHAAGVLQQRLILDETQDSLAATLRPKIIGTWVLHQLLKNKPNSLFISFSSVNSFFGGYTVGAYAAANSFLDSFSHYLRYQHSMQSYCFAWSMWDEIGMSRGYSMKELSRANGYTSITAKQGLNSFIVGLHYNQTHLLVGLDGSKNHIQRYLDEKLNYRQKLYVYFTSANESVKEKLRDSLTEMLRDRIGSQCTCDFIQLQEMPMLADGTPNRDALLELKGLKTQRSLPVQPQTELEKKIASIWQELLHLDAVDIHANFFDYGGNSLLLAQLNTKFRSAFNKQIPLTELFQYSTVSSQADFLEKGAEEILNSEIELPQIRGQDRRQKILSMKNKNRLR